MPRNGSGTYTLPSGNPVVSGTIIEASWANGTLSDLADAITNSLARNGEGGMTAPLRLTDGVVATPSLAFANETGSGLYRAAAGDIGLTVLGSRILRLQSGGASVTGTLGVSGATTLDSLGVTNNATVGGTFGVTGTSTFAAASATNFSYTGTLTGGTGVINIGSGQVYKDASGNVGIGTSSPTSKLSVNGVIDQISQGSSSAQIRAVNSGGTFYHGIDASTGGSFGSAYAAVLWHSGNYPMLFATNNGEKMRLDAAGNLGLGVTPSAWDSDRKAMQFASGTFSGSASTPSFAEFGVNYYANSSSIDTYTRSSHASKYRQYLGAHSWYTAPSGTVGAAISFTQAMTLTAAGELLVGSTSVSGKFHVSGSPASLSVATISGNDNGTYLTLIRPGTSGVYHRFSGGTTYEITVNTAGVSLANGGTSWGSLSDERKKDIIEPITNAAQKVSTLRTVIGKYKTDEEGTRRAFLIAQDVEKVLPEAINANDPDNLILQYTEVMPLLVAAFNELKAEFDAYKAAHP